jgi:hypothetical protein
MDTKEQKLRQAIADIFLSFGTYEDLEKCASGMTPSDDVVIWEPFEMYDFDTILEIVDNAYENIQNVCNC